ncbi:alpha/beta hydrolase [Gilvimarinus sp. SDUM040013]|uniref:Alpha/beta hydrolase n=1 Tax=Gilvimarinus gilvus TaxID=3058038 RepID=A0ABU4S2Y1_9GAMM|nr:alpha/beta hydrolase [Gilvimarinus sp. SDUM040013]MDO3387188.1 alpha/beta hydrolase [Gilvimarinus sp. SDUM040013]MDX6850751.1 alpha/beta hydrolase [Gilvimarinus sp. SDUM040013]
MIIEFIKWLCSFGGVSGKSAIFLLVSINVLLLMSGCSTVGEVSEISTSYGQSLYRYEMHEGPTLIMEVGLADEMDDWGEVLTELSSISGIFTYNRAGFRGSYSINSVRDAKTIVTELNELLIAAKVKPPFILVGHSLGGAYMELYAKTFPENIAGVLLIDPNDARYPAACKALELDHCEPPGSMPWWAELIYPRAVAGEIKAWSHSLEQVRRSTTFPPVPLAVLSAGNDKRRGDVNAIKRQELTQHLHRQLSELSSVSKHEVCMECGHYVHRDNPQLVVEAVRWILTSAGNL